MAWKKGPLPAGTYNWGGVVPAAGGMGGGFFFADFCGDHAVAQSDPPLRLEPHEVAWYDNGLELPPREAGATRRAGGPGAGREGL